jgi:hypothetical protein
MERYGQRRGQSEVRKSGGKVIGVGEKKESYSPEMCDGFVQTCSLSGNSEQSSSLILCSEPKMIMFFFQWIGVLSVAMLYNLVFVIGRATFWELQNALPTVWWFLDYGADFVYVVDSLIHAHEGGLSLIE